MTSYQGVGLGPGCDCFETVNPQASRPHSLGAPENAVSNLALPFPAKPCLDEASMISASPITLILAHLSSTVVARL